MTEKQIFVSAITDTHTVDKEGIGRLRWVGQKCYRYVYNNTGVALVAGSSYAHGTLLPGITGSTGEEEVVTQGQAGKGTVLNHQAGVAVSAIPIANYGWIQIYGFSTTVLIEGTVAVTLGASLKMVSGQVYLVQGAADGVAPVTRKYVTALVADAGGAGQRTLAKAFIMCL